MTDSAKRPDPLFQAIGDWLVDVALGDIDLEAMFLEFCNRILDAAWSQIEEERVAVSEFDHD